LGVTVKRVALFALLGSVAIASLLAIVGILGNGFGRLAVHALATAMVVAAGSVLALGNVGAWDLPSARVASRLGVLASCVGMIVLIACVWLEPRRDAPWLLACSLAIVAIAATHASMMWLARIGPRMQVLRTVALAVNVLLVVMTLAAVWGKGRSDALAEALAILAILECGLTLAIAAVAAASRAAPAGAGVAEVCFCPRCGKRLWQPAGEIRCHHCDEVFLVELRPAGELPSAVLRS
jgi:hypothetical protein